MIFGHEPFERQYYIQFKP